jgi:cellulose biosynthesis protein BcsQ
MGDPLAFVNVLQRSRADVGWVMAYENIPLNWETLGILGSVFSTAFGAGATVAWAIGHRITSLQLNQWQIKFGLAQQQAQVSEVELEKFKRKMEVAQDRFDADKRLIASLQVDLASALAQKENAQTVGSPLQTVEELEARVAKYEALRSALFGAEDEVWKLREPMPPINFRDRMLGSVLRVITVINLKGGVAKTTVVANLAAHFAKRGKKVLVIDFDYQGSLTRMMILGARLQLGKILADALLDGGIDGKGLIKIARDLGNTLPGVELIPCGQTFDGFEFRLMLKWLLRETEDDIRFRLAKLILSEEVQKAFNLVLIDAPPRLSTGAINALCASHAILVPTVLDGLSADAVGNFLQRADKFRELNPALEFAGVIGTITEQTALTDAEELGLRQARQALPYWHGQSHMFEHRLRHFRALSRTAGKDIGYLRDPGVSRTFDAIGEELAAKLSALVNT